MPGIRDCLEIGTLTLYNLGIGKTGRGVGAGAGDYLVKPGIGNREITCIENLSHVLRLCDVLLG